MKKIWLMLLLISSVCVFTACSDDDNDDKGENNGKNPITEFYLSDEIATGESTTVLGKGFTADAQIYVENAAGERTKIENVVANEKGITFTLPSTLETGNYALILKQDNGEWKLGTFKVLRMVEVTQVKKITAKMRQGEGEYFMDAPYDLAYDEYGRLKSFASTGETYDEDGNLVTSTLGYDFLYTGNRVEVNGSIIDNETVFPITYTIENGKVVNSKTKNYEFDWETEEGSVVDAEYTWNYEGDYLKSLTGSTTINYNYENGNLISIDEDYQFTYSKEVNNSNIDVVACILYFNNELTSERFLATLMGTCGKISANLPESVLGTCSYSRDNNGLVGAVDVKMGDYVLTISFEYETVKVIAE